MRSATKKGFGKDPEYLTWLHTQPCMITSRRPVTVHHVRLFGGPRIDRRGLPLIAELHMLTHEKPGRPCVERGKKVFEEFWGVVLEDEILRYNNKYAAKGLRWVGL